MINRRIHPAVDAGASSRAAAPDRTPATDRTVAPRAVSFRAVLIGILCAAFLCAVTPVNDYKLAATFLAGNQFPIGAMFVLFFMVAVVNVVLRKLAPPYAFRPGELLTIWVLMVVASGLPSSGMMRYFVPLIVAPTYYANDKNNWDSKIIYPLPEWLKFKDKAAADAFFTGYPRGQEHVPWDAWVGPLFFWGILAVLFLTASFCVANVLRRQWVENEKFVFPLVTLPVLISEEPERGRVLPSLLRQPLFWLAVAAVTVYHTFNGLNRLYPSIPGLTNVVNIGEYLTSPPYNGVGWFPLYFYPLVIGISYLLSTEVCFSLWFFYLFHKFQLVLFRAYNWDVPGTYVGYGSNMFGVLEAFGGALALVIWTAWSARSHLRDFWEKATGGARAREIDDECEMFSYRATLIGLIVSYGGIALWMMLAQVPMTIVLISLLVMTVAFVLIGWMVCQAGMLMMQLPGGTADFVGATLGTGAFKATPMYTLTRFEGMFLYDSREMLVASVLNGTKTADAASFSARKLFRAMVASIAIGVVISAVAAIQLPYMNGGANVLKDSWGYNIFPTKQLNFLAGTVDLPRAGSWGNYVHMGGGLVGVLGLLVLRAQFNFGLHPIGFLAAPTYPANTLWGSIFVGWLFKTLIQRYGGMKGYKLLLPFFLGLILADVLNAVVWIVLGFYLEQSGQGYRIMPG